MKEWHLEVIEVGCPAVHKTIADPATVLPTDTDKFHYSRVFDDKQKFIRILRHYHKDQQSRYPAIAPIVCPPRLRI